MSNPPNPLAKYRTYSYHQFLLACSDTSAAESLTTSNTDLTTLQHPAGDRYQVRSGGNGQYVTLIDGMSDAHLSITKSTWKTLLSSNRKTADGAYADLGVNADGILDIYEANGANFLGIIANSAVQMGIPQVSLTYAIKTIFIGHTIDGQSEYIHSVKPFLFTAYDISAVFNSTGAKYRMAIIGQAGSNTKSDQLVLSGSSQKIENASTIAESMARMEALINTAVEDGVGEYEKLQDTNGESTSDAIPPKHKIVIDGDFGSDEIIMGDNSNIRTSDKRGDTIVNLANGSASTVPKAIERVLSTSSTIMKGAKVQNKGAAIEQRHIYNVHHVTKILPKGGKLHEYHIRRKIVKTVAPGADVSAEAANLTFDYLFTGKNTDIVHMDMKLLHGINVINTLITTPSVPTLVMDLDGITPDAIVGKSGAQSSGGASVVPSHLEIGSNFDHPAYSNTNYPVATSTFYNAIAKAAEVDAIGTAMTIHGNPALLDEMTVNPSSFEKGGFKGSALGEIHGNWLDDPTLIRVNVRFPANPNDLAAGTVPFWFDGLYRILSIEHMFSAGKFTQKLHFGALMGSHPVDNAEEVAGGTAAEHAEAAGVPVRTPSGTGGSGPVKYVTNGPNLGEMPESDVIRLRELEDIRDTNIDEGNCDPDDPHESWDCFGSEAAQKEHFAIRVAAGNRNFIVRDGDVPLNETAEQAQEGLEDLDGFSPEDFRNLANDGADFTGGEIDPSEEADSETEAVQNVIQADDLPVNTIKDITLGGNKQSG